MNQISFSQTEQLLLRDLGVRAVILFGSQALGIARLDSDYDFGVILDTSTDRKKAYDTLYDLLSAKINKLVNIDIVFLDTAPMELQAHVAKHGLALYQSDSRIFADFKERVMNIYADFSPLRTIFSNATLSRISP